MWVWKDQAMGNDKQDEILGMLRMLDTKIGFIEQDMNDLKEMIANIGQTNVECFARILTAVENGEGEKKTIKVERM